MSNGMAQVSILERLGLSGVEATPFTLKWVEKAFSEENIDILNTATYSTRFNSFRTSAPCFSIICESTFIKS